MKIRLKLVGKEREMVDVISFHFQPELPITYQPGQYLHYFLPHPNADNRGEERYFTISSAPSEGSISITTKFSPQGSSFKRALKSLQIGQYLQAEGPEGDFTYDGPKQEVVWIAGGMGITPYRSIAVELASQNLTSPITLLYSNKNPRFLYKDLLDDLASKGALKVIYTVTEPEAGWTGEVGRIDEEFIRKHIPNLQKPISYISGPELMVEALEKKLAAMGIPPEHIKTDFFPGYPDI